MLLCYLYVRRLFDQRAALIAALMMGTSFQYLQAGTGARVDMTLTAFLEIALFEFLAIAEGVRQRTAPLYLAIAFALLTKGPIGVFIPLMVGALWLVWWRRWDLLPRLELARGALIVGLIGGGWYLAAIATGGADFIHKQILAENFYRLFHHSGFNQGHAHSFYYEDAALLAGFMPWSPIAILAAIHYLRRPRPLDARFGYLLVWFFAVLIFYNLPQSKRGIYLLALYPALSALVAIMSCAWLDTPAVGARGLRLLSRLTGVCFALTGAAALLALMLLGLLPAPIRWILEAFELRAAGLVPQLRLAAYDHLIASIALPLATFAIGARLLRSPPRVDRLVIATTAAMVVVALAVNIVVGVAIANTLALKDFAAEALRIAGNEPLGYFGSLDYGFAFYSGRNIHFTTGRDADPPPFIVASEDGLKLMPTAMLLHYIVVLRSNPTDLDGSGAMLLLKRIDRPPPLARPPAAPPSPTKQYELSFHRPRSRCSGY
jgi:4-amino-4-deoxy-L-arabinose transferase-like glycosyltransferase